MAPSPQALQSLLPLMAGAAAGGTLRHLAVANAAPRVALARVCAVNTAGSFVLGATQALRRAGRISQRASLALGTGFCGALTTFSTFAAQLHDLSHGASAPRRVADATAYVLVSVLLGVAAVAGGRAFGRMLSK